jgi:hypothetical protein
VSPAHKAPRVSKATPARKDPPVRKAQRALKGLKALPDLQDRRPSTAASARSSIRTDSWWVPRWSRSADFCFVAWATM